MENACVIEAYVNNDNDNVKKNISEINNNLNIAFYLNRPITNEKKVMVKILICIS